MNEGEDEMIGNIFENSYEITLEGLYIEVLSPEEFLRFYNEEKQHIRSVRVIPPIIGQKGFGKIVVIRNTPKYTIPQRAKSLR